MAGRRPRRTADTALASRRTFLAGAAAAGGTLATFRARRAVHALVPATTTIVAWRVPRLPDLDDPGSKVWDRSIVASVVLDGQVTAPPVRLKPAVPRMKVTALHDRRSIAFRLEWKDDRCDDLTIGSDAFRDACAVLLGPTAGDQALRFMGSADVPVTLLHWKADWQRDLERGFQDLEVEFPNSTFDLYPPLAPAEADVGPEDYAERGATQWLPGMHVGNPISTPEKTTAVEKIVARGFGSATTQPTQNAEGHGIWSKGGWRVIIRKPLEGVDDEELTLVPGESYAAATAMWSGSAGDAGGKKSPSKSLLTLEVTGW